MTSHFQGPGARGPVRVLLVARAASARSLLARLREDGFRPEPERIEMLTDLPAVLAAGPFEIAICEDGLPGADAPAVLRSIRQLRPGLPVIIVSSLFGESVAAAAMAAGADDFLPYGSLSRLSPAVERELKTAAMRRRWEETARHLTEVEARGKAFLDNSPAIAFMKDERGRIVYVNPQWERVFGLRFESVRDRADAEWLPADAAELVRSHDRAVLEGDRTMQFEESLPAADGVHEWLVFRFPFRDASGARFVGGVGVDITDRKRAEDRIRAAADLHRDLIEHGQVLLCVHDLEGRVLAVNDVARRSLGFAPDEDLVRMGVTIPSILAPESLERFPGYLERIRSTGAASGVMVVQTVSGEKRYWEYRNSLRTEGVDIPIIRGLAFDITERVRMEEALRDARQFAEEILASAGLGVIVYGSDLRYVLWNRAMQELTGFSEEKVLGKTMPEVFPHLVRQGLWELVRRALRGESVSSPDIRFQVSATSEVRWASSKFTPHRNAQGRIVGVIGTVEDVTDRKRSEESLRESQEFIERAQEVGQIGSWVSGVGPDARLVWSKETCRIFGIDPEGFDGRLETFFELVHPEDRHALRDATRSALELDRPYSIEHRIVRPDGTVLWVYERGDVVRSPEGDPIRIVGIVQDITDRRRLEEQFLQAQKMEAIGRLAGGIAHDFNNLLTAILGYTDLLISQTDESHPTRGDLEEIQKAGDRAAALTRQLLAFSRQQMLEPRVIDLNEILGSLENMVRRLIGEDVALVTRLEPGLGLVRADPGQIEQVILNLVVNSRDAMPGGGTLTITTGTAVVTEPVGIGRAAVPPGRYSVVDVTDTGSGMDAATQARIFEPFFTTKEKGKGTGLGLATAYGIIKQSGGYIVCETQPGRGTTFRLYLPGHAGVGESASPPRARVSRAPAGGRRTVLLVEDEDAVRRLSRRLLEADGYQVLEAPGGERAIALARSHPGPIDLLLTDVVMPDLKGPEVAARVAKLRPAIQVLYMSGYANVELADLGPGAVLLQKPFTPETLAAKMEEAVRGDHGPSGRVLPSEKDPSP
jgi:two-component system cell cycle sensor histidine kinase/response regulator CckA